MISRSHHFLFVHIPKTGGNSVARALLPLAEDQVVIDSPWHGYDRFGLQHPQLATSKHSPLSEYQTALGDELDDLFVFTTIRDPWSRMMSYYYSPHRQTGHWDREAFMELAVATPSSLTYMTPDGSDNARSIADLGVDFFLRFEHLESDFAQVCERLGVDATLPHLNPSTRPSLFDVYDLDLVDFIADRFASEIELFGYQPPALVLPT